VGSLREPAWGSEPEQGGIFRVAYTGVPAFGIQEVVATRNGFTLTFFAAADDRDRAADPKSYRLRRYRHVFAGSYHSPPTDEEVLHVESATVTSDAHHVRLVVREDLIADRIYEVRTTLPNARPAEAHYTMNRVPR
jgi:hypothetical protein